MFLTRKLIHLCLILTCLGNYKQVVAYDNYENVFCKTLHSGHLLKYQKNDQARQENRNCFESLSEKTFSKNLYALNKPKSKLTQYEFTFFDKILFVKNNNSESGYVSRIEGDNTLLNQINSGLIIPKRNEILILNRNENDDNEFLIFNLKRSGNILPRKISSFEVSELRTYSIDEENEKIIFIHQNVVSRVSLTSNSLSKLSKNTPVVENLFSHSVVDLFDEVQIYKNFLIGVSKENRKIFLVDYNKNQILTEVDFEDLKRENYNSLYFDKLNNEIFFDEEQFQINLNKNNKIKILTLSY